MCFNGLGECRVLALIVPQVWCDSRGVPLPEARGSKKDPKPAIATTSEQPIDNVTDSVVDAAGRGTRLTMWRPVRNHLPDLALTLHTHRRQRNLEPPGNALLDGA